MRRVRGVRLAGTAFLTAGLLANCRAAVQTYQGELPVAAAGLAATGGRSRADVELMLSRADAGEQRARHRALTFIE